jgi:hypothetical protein
MEMSGQLHSTATLPRYPLERKVSGPQSRSGSGGEEKITLSCRESNPGRPAGSLAALLTELPRLPALLNLQQWANRISKAARTTTDRENNFYTLTHVIWWNVNEITSVYIALYIGQLVLLGKWLGEHVARMEKTGKA